MRIVLGWCLALLSSALLGGAVYQVVLTDPRPPVIAQPAPATGLPTHEPTPRPTITRTVVRTVVDPTPTITIDDVVTRVAPTAPRTSAAAPQRTIRPIVERTRAPKAPANRETLSVA